MNKSTRIARVMILGAGGQLGWSLTRLYAEENDVELISLSHRQLDIVDEQSVVQCFEKRQPHIIINAAAHTDVDGSETESGRQQAFRVNALGPQHIAWAAQSIGAKLVHLSTDYVFPGTQSKPHIESDPTAPLNVYGESKLNGEARVKDACAKSFILRTAWLYGNHGKNFVNTMVALGQKSDTISVVDDQVGSPTWVRDLGRQIMRLVQSDGYGIYHATAQGQCSWFEFATSIFEQLNIRVEVKPVSSAEFSRPAPRPQNSVLENHQLKACHLDIMPDWRDSLTAFLSQWKRSHLGG